MEYLWQYLLFTAKLATLVVALAALLTLLVGLSRKGGIGAGLHVERLNDHFERLAATVRRHTLSGAAWKREQRSRRKAASRRRKGGSEAGGRIFVLDFKGDIRATQSAALREEVTAIVAAAEPGDRVMVRLENAGGTVHEHGLAASQLQRLRDAGLKLTVTVDKVAASGGYLMACVADRIVAAPFAIIGSIGVIAQLPNFHRWLTERGVDFEQITAGRYKRTLTLFGENTEQGREKMREDLEDVHHLFQDLVHRHRGELNMDEVATGEIWYGSRALEMGLVDEIATSDDLLMKAASDAEILLVQYRSRRSLQERVLGSVESAVGHLRRLLEFSGPAQPPGSAR